MNLSTNGLKNVHGVWLPEPEKHLLGFANKEGWTYQKHKLDKAIQFVRKFDVAVDIGGHCGLWSMHLAGLFNHVYAFEPIPIHRDAFQLNVDMTNVDLIPVALGDKVGEVRLKWGEVSSGDTKVTEETENTILADMKTLDDFWIKPDFIKIDTEGFELFILKGGEETILQNKPVIIVEQKPGKAKDYGLKDTEAVDWLKARGYKLRDTISGDYILA